MGIMEHNIASILLPQAAHIISCRSYVRGLKWNWSHNWCIFWLLKEHITGACLLTLESVGEHYTSKITQYFLFRMLCMFPSAFYVRNSMYKKNLCCQNSQRDTAQPNNIWQNQTCNIRNCTTQTTDVTGTHLKVSCDWTKKVCLRSFISYQNHPLHQKTFQIKAKYHTPPSWWTNYNTASSYTLLSWGFFITGTYICQHKN